MKPLAYLMRPNTFEDIVGQDHLVGKTGIIKKMLNTNSLFSFILYGNPGCGKTTIAEATCKLSGFKWFKFNASTDNKETLKQIITEASFLDDAIIIVDEIHRMKKDIQDYLLPYVENGTVIMIGLTTVNPYHSVNPAIRSRCHVYRLNDLTSDHLRQVLDRAYKYLDKEIKIDEEVYNYVINLANGEIRTLINLFETLVKTSTEHITLNDAKTSLSKANVSFDANGDSYYDTLSGLHKSIRGSDVDAALHYLARLITLEDIDIIARRLMIIAYEDIGLGNPQMGPRVLAACEVAKKVGFPEARIPLSMVVVELALSPKSNSTYEAFAKAMEDYENNDCGDIPPHILNREIGHNGVTYKYPHDYPDSWVNQEYMPKNLVGHRYYEGAETGAYERQLKGRYLELLKRKNRI